MLEKALQLVWEEITPYDLIEMTQDTQNIWGCDYLFSPSGEVIEDQWLEFTSNDYVILEMEVWERGERGQRSVDFLLGLLETDLIMGQLFWRFEVKYADRSLLAGRAVTKRRDLASVFIELEFVEWTRSDTVARLEALYRNLKGGAETADTQ